MITDSERQFLDITSAAAETAGHIFPTMAACEAALESGYGSSRLAIEGNNLFGTKQHEHAIYGTLSLPTREYLGGDWKVVSAQWVSYPTIADAFHDRMNTLIRLAPVYPHYANALAAPDAETFVGEVSKTWSTDPNRAIKVIAIHSAYLQLKRA